MDWFCYIVFIFYVFPMKLSYASHDSCKVEITGFQKLDGMYINSYKNKTIFNRTHMKSEISLTNNNNGTCFWKIYNVEFMYPFYINNECSYSIEHLSNWELHTGPDNYTVVTSTHVSPCIVHRNKQMAIIVLIVIISFFVFCIFIRQCCIGVQD